MNNKLISYKGQLIESIIKTCEAFPAQWEIKLNNGRMVYVRYRSGYLSITISNNPTDDIYEAVRGEEICRIQLGDCFDGSLEDEELTPHLNKALQKLDKEESND